MTKKRRLDRTPYLGILASAPTRLGAGILAHAVSAGACGLLRARAGGSKMAGGQAVQGRHRWAALVRPGPIARLRRRHAPAEGGAALALVVVVETPGPGIAEIRERYDPGARRGMPPHVTVLYPVPDPGLGSTGVEQVGDRLSKVLVEHEPFGFRLETIGRFPGVVYLAPDPADPFVELTAAVSGALGLAPYGGRFDQVVPHLTVALGRRLPRRARRSLHAALPVAAVARDVQVFRQEGGTWTHRCTIPLGSPAQGTPAQRTPPCPDAPASSTSGGVQPLQEE